MKFERADNVKVGLGYPKYISGEKKACRWSSYKFLEEFLHSDLALGNSNFGF
jgi:hypothetical protein